MSEDSKTPPRPYGDRKRGEAWLGTSTHRGIPLVVHGVDGEPVVAYLTPDEARGIGLELTILANDLDPNVSKR